MGVRRVPWSAVDNGAWQVHGSKLEPAACKAAGAKLSFFVVLLQQRATQPATAAPCAPPTAFPRNLLLASFVQTLLGSSLCRSTCHPTASTFLFRLFQRPLPTPPPPAVGPCRRMSAAVAAVSITCSLQPLRIVVVAIRQLPPLVSSISFDNRALATSTVDHEAFCRAALIPN